MRRVLVLLTALVLLAGCSTGLEKKPSTTLPKVILSSLTGSPPVDAAALKGPVVLSFWAQWCDPCRKELPIYQQFHTAHPDVKVIGVDTLDTQPALARKLLAETGVDYPQLTDPDGKVVHTKALPVLVMLDAQGTIVYREAIRIRSLSQLEKLVDKHLGST